MLRVPFGTTIRYHPDCSFSAAVPPVPPVPPDHKLLRWQGLVLHSVVAPSDAFSRARGTSISIRLNVPSSDRELWPWR
jgi:hypothetical protein